MSLPVQVKRHDVIIGGGTIMDMSLLGCGICVPKNALEIGDVIAMDKECDGRILARVCRRTAQNMLGTQFVDVTPQQRRQLIIDLFTDPIHKPFRADAQVGKTALSMLQRL